MKYISTRGGGEPQTFQQVLLSGLAPDGGLYVPQSFPQLDLDALRGKSYQDVAEAVMFPFVEGSISRTDLRAIINETYSAENFRHTDVVPLHHVQDNLYTLELFHGPTIAFKDVALQLLGRLFNHMLKDKNKRVTIVGATSGDTGSAAIEGCKACDLIDIFILHPSGRVSDVQRKQMTTIDAPNVHNIALDGTFDDCQNIVKAMFNDHDFRDDVKLSAINSINWARIMAQIVYYVTSALELGVPDKEASFVVPTGNFGNVFAAYCARQMGLPIKTLGIATNRNDILTRFFESGEMKMNETEASLSPSMDIQISSNFERYLYFLLDGDSAQLIDIMTAFKNTGAFKVSDEALAKARAEFKASRADDARTLGVIKDVHVTADYTLDPHTAVGYSGALEIAKEEGGAVVSLACAHPAKFPDAVKKACGIHPELPEHLSDLFERKEILTEKPNNLEMLQAFVRTNIGLA